MVLFLWVQKFPLFGIWSFVLRGWLRTRIPVRNPAQDLLGLSWLPEQSFCRIIGIAFLMSIGPLGFILQYGRIRDDLPYTLVSFVKVTILNPKIVNHSRPITNYQ
jgi:hypothetical protein